MPPNAQLQALAIAMQCVAILVTLTGFAFVLLQIRAAQKNAMMSSLISAVANHWMLIEERRYKIRSGELKPRYRHLFTTLEQWLTDQYQGNLKAMADDFLWENQSEIAAEGKSAVFDAITRELAFQDLIFNLYEEEFIAGKYLNLVSKELWDYWDLYIRQNFRNKKIRNLWRLRNEFGIVFPKFVEFVEREYLSSRIEDAGDKAIG